MRLGPTLFVVAALTVGAACGKDDQDPDRARKVWDQIHEGDGFTSWERAPGYPERRPSFTAHSDAVEIFVSKEVSAALRSRTPVTRWPTGATIVKEGYSGSKRKLVAVMQRDDAGWFWAEYDDGGESIFSGAPSVCTDCHDNRREYSDWVYSFEFPR